MTIMGRRLKIVSGHILKASRSDKTRFAKNTTRVRLTRPKVLPQTKKYRLGASLKLAQLPGVLVRLH